MTISVISCSLESMGGFFALKNPQISNPSQHLLRKSSYGLKDICWIFIQNINLVVNERKS